MPAALAQQAKRPFTVADDIGLTHLTALPNLRFSPDGKYLAVWNQRGRLESNSVETSLRFYRTEDIQAFLANPASQAPEPAWVATVTTKKEPGIDYWRWLPDSSGVAFQKWMPDDVRFQAYPVMLADLRSKKIEQLTSPADEIHERNFAVAGGQNYVFAVADHTDWQKKQQSELKTGAIVGTGLRIWDILFPNTPLDLWGAPATNRLWAVNEGKRFEVQRDGQPPAFMGELMALSPDGKSLATIAPVSQVPPSWETLYPPPAFLPSPFGDEVRPIHPGQGAVRQFVRINLQSGLAEPLVDAPSLDSVGIPTAGDVPPVWSSDGRAVLLPGTFLKPKENEPARPCVAIVDIRSKSASCIVQLKEGYSKNTDPVDDFHRPAEIITDFGFAPGDTRGIFVSFDTRGGDWGITRRYQQQAGGSWQFAGETIGNVVTGPGGLEIKVTQTFKDPPLLVAANKGRSRVLWDPNPQLKNVELADVSIYQWKDPDGRTWKGGLYKPVNYQPGKRYPLVIQTHGFGEKQFAPSGLFTTAFAAQEFATNGIMVLQTAMPLGEDCKMNSTEEGPCYAQMLESAAKQLVSEGLVDPEKVGVIGFSRTCYHVMEMLTRNVFHLKAASITDGLLGDHFTYVIFGGYLIEEWINGGKPYGEGLLEWAKRSPEFNLDKVQTPLLVSNMDNGFGGALTMWAPYAGLHDLKKPVDFIIFNGTEHTLTNPVARMVSQGGSVDWFRFWLQGYEDPDPAKAEQYKRWRGLRELQAANEKNAAVSQTATAH